ncbi:E3 ubiquitin-protein ligase MARCHF8-like isoform X2 [Ostrinia nubilalis]|uniref:E3 ubiquitin-protein ligase MARCHF8-like isoform X2 n=1 Tax=Ostrinia nubilalis TaxID=29057 RepID=UPI0030823740
MDDKDKPDTKDTEDLTNTVNVNKDVKPNNNTNQNDAGPSSLPLPGATENIKINLQITPGLSKSEHSICHIITTKDVANALRSLNISANPVLKTNINELKIPIFDKDDKEEADPTTFVDLKKFMASCFKINKETHSGIILGDIQNVAAPVITGEVIQEVPNTSCNTAPIKPNEVVVTSGVEQKVSKVGSDKKKTSGNLSERSTEREFPVAQRDSLSSIGSNVCRICMTRGRERLISPCNCKGSLANVHLSCLERWLNQVGRNHCELCGYSYPAIRTPRYTVLQALRLWFGNPRNRSHLQSDCLIFWLLSTVTAGLLAVCIVGTQYFVIEGNKFGISHRITETAMDFFMAIVLCGYSVTVYLLWKDHYVMWNRWRRANVNVRLLLSPDANPVPFVPRPRYNIV